jgi:hypothetical protein
MLASSSDLPVPWFDLPHADSADLVVGVAYALEEFAGGPRTTAGMLVALGMIVRQDTAVRHVREPPMHNTPDLFGLEDPALVRSDGRLDAVME